MIIDAILLIVQGFLNVLLAPLTLVNIAIDVVGSIPVIGSFLNIISYVLPWSNILPIFAIIVAVMGFRITLSLIKAIWHFVPFIGN